MASDLEPVLLESVDCEDDIPAPKFDDIPMIYVEEVDEDCEKDDIPKFDDKKRKHVVSYYSSADDNGYDGEVDTPKFDDKAEMNVVEYSSSDKEYALYPKQCNASAGFDVDAFPKARMLHKIIPIRRQNSKAFPKLHILANLAIVDYNQRNNDKKGDYSFMRILKANARTGYGIIYYITFEAKAPCSDDITTFQAEVLDGIWSTEVYMVQIKPAN